MSVISSITYINISIIYYIEDCLYLEFARSSGYRVFETK